MADTPSQAVATLFAAASLKSLDERASFLSESGGDADLLGEVESMLHAFDALDPGLQEAIRSMSLSPDSEGVAYELSAPEPDDRSGTSISCYRLERRVGSGGFGSVYEAFDTRLQRKVAVKLLSASARASENASARFMQEAKAASQIDHANVCTIFDVGEEGGFPFMVMPFYSGDTLSQRIRTGPLSTAAALRVAEQMAAGLVAAHRHGIVHRDIKPANVILSESGDVKLLDFGLAKLADESLTVTGSIMGTAPYMSPEQIQSKRTDEKTDIWSLGVVLYEMLAGRRPFEGVYAPSLLYSILNTEPAPIPGIDDRVRPLVESILARSLEKEPGDRFSSMEELLFGARLALADSETTPYLNSLSRFERRRWTVRAFGVLAALLMVVFVGWVVSRILPFNTVAFTSEPLTNVMGLAAAPSWSQDGRSVAYHTSASGNMDIWVRSLDSGVERPLSSSPTHETNPTWNPRLNMIAFSTDNDGIEVINADGTGRTQIWPTGRRPVWSPDGSSLVFERLNTLMISPLTPIAPEVLVSGLTESPHPVWLPDGKAVLFWHHALQDVFVVDIATREIEALGLIPRGQTVSGLALSSSGQRLLVSIGEYGGDKRIDDFDFDPGSRAVSTIPSHLVPAVLDNIEPAIMPGDSALVYVARRTERRIVRYFLNPRTATLSGELSPVSQYSRLNYYPSISRDGNRISWTRHDGSGGQVVTLEAGQAREERISGWPTRKREFDPVISPDGKQFVFGSLWSGMNELWLGRVGEWPVRITESADSSGDGHAVWSPDGATIAFYSNRSGKWAIWTAETSGSGVLTQETASAGEEMNPSWHPSQNLIAFVSTRSGGNPDIWIKDRSTGEERPFVEHPAQEGWSSWSPDGEWFYFVSDRSGHFNIWAMPGGGGAAHQVTEYNRLETGLSEEVLFTKFGVGPRSIVVSEENRTANLQILRNVDLR